MREGALDLIRTATLTIVAVAVVGCASQPIPAAVVYAPTVVLGCEYVGIASDTGYIDLAEKAGELRGTHAVVVREQPRRHAFGYAEYVAEVYRCPTVSKR
jgi:hypothetical protein